MQEFFSQIEANAEPLWPLEIREDRSSTRRLIATTIAVAVGFGLLSAAGRLLAESSGHLFSFCAADGVLAAFLLLRTRKNWSMFLLAAWLGDAVSMWAVLRYPLLLVASVTFCNVLEALIAALLLQWALGWNRDFAWPATMLRFLALGVLLAPAMAGFPTAICYHLATGESVASAFGKLYPAYALGMAVMVPLTLVFYNPDLRKLFARSHILRTVGILLLVPLTGGLIFHQTHHSLRFLWLPLLMLVVLETGMLGAVIATFEVLVVGTVYTLQGYGPLWLDKGATLRGSILILQFSILVLLVSIVPFAATLERQRQLRKGLVHQMRQYQLLADNSRDIVVLANLEGRRLYVSPAVYDVLGWTQQEWADQNAADFMHRDDIKEFRRVLKEMLQGVDRRTIRYRTRHKKGEYVWMEANLRTLPDDTTGKPSAFVANIRDISERVESERKLAEAHEHVQQQAQRDSLTQLANRRCFDDALEREWRRGRRTGNPLALLMVDIDHFKNVNDSYGHRAGDHCLQMLATILRSTVRRPGDLIARYGGEEFAVLLPDIDLATAAVMADMLCLRLREQLFEVGTGTSLTLTVSVGVAAQVPDKDTRADALVEAADRAMYAAKQAGRNRVMPEYQQDSVDTIAPSSALLDPIQLNPVQ